MNAKRTTPALALAAFCAAVVSTALAAEDAGKKAEACAACHGPQGNKPVTPDTPRLAGQHYEYLVQALVGYRKGTRSDPVMGAMAKPLSDEDIRDLASYYSTQRGLAASGAPRPAQ
ncbi:MAG TPA: cytochrome c [Burkholderiales bacterium]|nr:cytochrome c [Burkholderiales bacterium]